MDLLSAALLKKGLSSWELTAYLLPNSHLGRDGASWATSWVMSCSGATVNPSGASQCSLLTYTHKGEWWRTQSYDGHGHSDFSKNGPPVPGSALYNSTGLVGGKAPFPGSLQGHLEVTGLVIFHWYSPLTQINYNVNKQCRGPWVMMIITWKVRSHPPTCTLFTKILGTVFWLLISVSTSWTLAPSSKE